MAKLLMDMSDDELMANYRKLNDTTQHGTASYEAECNRRAQKRYANWMMLLAVASTITSIVAVIVSVMKK